MAQLHLVKVKSASGTVLFTRKNKKKVERKLELLKFDKATRKREIFKEVKK